MKADIHPNYRPVVFQDTTSGESWITRSTIETDETTTWEDGKRVSPRQGRHLQHEPSRSSPAP